MTLTASQTRFQHTLSSTFCPSRQGEGLDHTIPKRCRVGQQDSTHQFRQRYKVPSPPVLCSGKTGQDRIGLDPWPVCTSTHISLTVYILFAFQTVKSKMKIQHKPVYIPESHLCNKKYMIKLRKVRLSINFNTS